MPTVKEYLAYKFEELPEDLEEKVLDKHRNFNVEDNDWWNFVYEIWVEKLEEMGFMKPKIWFSGFWSQGDGACFDCDSMDLDKFVKAHAENLIPIFFPHTRFLREIPNVCRAWTVTVNPHYSHYNTRDMRFEWDEFPEGLEATGEIEGMLTQFEALVESVREEKSKEIYRALEEEYEYLTTDESVAEALTSNDYEFDEDGDIC